MNPWDWGRPAMLSEDEYSGLDYALWSHIAGKAFNSYMETRRGYPRTGRPAIIGRA